MSIVVEIEIDPENEIGRITAAYNRKVKKALIGAVGEILDAIEAAQIHKYTKTAFPPLPPGSRYDRTFTLRDTSQKQITSRDLPEIRGEWSTTGEATYDKEVLGSRADQAPIHQNRWKSLEDVEAEIERLAPEVVLDAMEKISR